MQPPADYSRRIRLTLDERPDIAAAAVKAVLPLRSWDALEADPGQRPAMRGTAASSVRV